MRVGVILALEGEDGVVEVRVRRRRRRERKRGAIRGEKGGEVGGGEEEEKDEGGIAGKERAKVDRVIVEGEGPWTDFKKENDKEENEMRRKEYKKNGLPTRNEWKELPWTRRTHMPA